MYFPEVGDALPRRGNAVSKIIGRAIIRVWGWRFQGEIPNVSKAVVIVAPHTSNWDFVLGIAGVFAVGIRFSFLGKHTLFRGVAGSAMRWLGGIPVDRSASSGVVEQTVELFKHRSQLLLGVSPEGTRGRVDRWRSGFYHIACGAGVPIVPVSFDYPTRIIAFGEPVMGTGDMDGDMVLLRSFFSGVSGRKVEFGFDHPTG